MFFSWMLGPHTPLYSLLLGCTYCCTLHNYLSIISVLQPKLYFSVELVPGGSATTSYSKILPKYTPRQPTVTTRIAKYCTFFISTQCCKNCCICFVVITTFLLLTKKIQPPWMKFPAHAGSEKNIQASPCEMHEFSKWNKSSKGV